jgi:hypothetical protein
LPTAAIFLCNDAVIATSVRAINPNATEVCNKRDDDCDLLIDEDLFIDLDGDGFGNATASNASCAAFYPLTDCDDRNDDDFLWPDWAISATLDWWRCCATVWTTIATPPRPIRASRRAI